MTREQIVANYTFKNFDMAYYPFPFEQVAELWIQQGGQGTTPQPQPQLLPFSDCRRSVAAH
jgi:hypothetical protein